MDMNKLDLNTGERWGLFDDGLRWLSHLRDAVRGRKQELLKVAGGTLRTIERGPFALPDFKLIFVGATDLIQHAF